ncbi:MAG: rod shape-determining protein, partial [Candidatus Paceibacterota bacterium]
MEVFRNTYNRIYPLVTTDIGIDLGTANTLVYIRGKGIVLNEPSVVAINRKTNQVVAVGADAKKMLGRTPKHIDAIRPLVEGVISDFDIAQEMMAYLVSKSREMVSGKLIAPRIVIGVPSGITNVERRAVHDAAKAAGARSVYLVEEPVAAAVGIQLPIHDPVGNMIIDIGGGTTDIAILSLGGVVTSRNVRIGGDHFDAAISAYVRSEFRVLIGEKTAEHLKITAGRVIEGEEAIEVKIKGRDVVTGLPREVEVTDSDVREAIIPAL